MITLREFRKAVKTARSTGKDRFKLGEFEMFTERAKYCLKYLELSNTPEDINISNHLRKV